MEMVEINEEKSEKKVTKSDKATKNSLTKEKEEKKSKTNFYRIDGLPSLGKLYPEETVIEGRPLRVLEVKKLTTLSEENANYVINDVIRNCIMGINLDDLLVADKLYIVFWLRWLS